MVSIDAVYQKVLALANKEQRGYITPQEFNLFADHAQMEIFEQYFYDLNQFKRLPGNQSDYSDVVDIIKNKISIFEYFSVGYNLTVLNQQGDVNLKNDIPNLYRLGEVSVRWPNQLGFTRSSTCEQLTIKEFGLRSSSKITKHSKNRPVYIKYNNNYDRIKIYPYPTTIGYVDANGVALPDGSLIPEATKQAGVNADYIRKPTKPNWAYVVVNNKPLYNTTSAVDFELHASEETELVYRILALFGIAIEKPQLTQIAAGLQGSQIQQEKQ